MRKIIEFKKMRPTKKDMEFVAFQKLVSKEIEEAFRFEPPPFLVGIEIKKSLSSREIKINIRKIYKEIKKKGGLK